MRGELCGVAAEPNTVGVPVRVEVADRQLHGLALRGEVHAVDPQQGSAGRKVQALSHLVRCGHHLSARGNWSIRTPPL